MYLAFVSVGCDPAASVIAVGELPDKSKRIL